MILRVLAGKMRSLQVEFYNRDYNSLTLRLLNIVTVLQSFSSLKILNIKLTRLQ